MRIVNHLEIIDVNRYGAVNAAIFQCEHWRAVKRAVKCWQRKLLLQLGVTRDTFGGVPAAERPGRDIDAHLFALAQRLAPQLPPDPSRRVFLLYAAKGHQYDRLKLQYHLLPRNVFNFGSSLPEPGTFRAGDHVLLLGSIPSVAFDATSGLLRDDDRALAASPVDVTDAAALYRLEAEAPAP